MLVRYSPFGEWVNIYYQPEKITEAKMLELIHKGGCRNSKLIRSNQDNATMNPYVAPGDTVQVRLKLPSASDVAVTSLPKGWVSANASGKLNAGTHYLNIRTPKTTTHGSYSIKVKAGGSVVSYPVTVVKLVR